jgi:hypothetical protein
MWGRKGRAGARARKRAGAAAEAAAEAAAAAVAAEVVGKKGCREGEGGRSGERRARVRTGTVAVRVVVVQQGAGSVAAS